MPAGTILTAGSDETVRIWNVDRTLRNSKQSFSHELRKILYVGDGPEALHEQPDKNFGAVVSDTIDATTGVRCLKLSADGTHLAVGERNGNLRYYSLALL